MDPAPTIWESFGTIVTSVTGAIPEAVSTFGPVLGLLALVGIGLGIARKFGVRR